MSNPKISIIIPVYNVKPYLRECLDSVMKQTYSNWECIIIDDGSSDGSESICDDYLKKDERFICIHKKNEGVSVARNTGLDIAKGEWVAFVDSDDVISTDYLKNLATHIRCDEQIIFTGYDTIGRDYLMLFNETDILGNEVIPFFISGQLVKNTQPWSKLYSLQTINNNMLRFPKGVHIGEDAIFLFSYMNFVEMLTLTADIDYHNRFRDGSLSSKICSFASEWDGFTLWKKQLNKLLTKAYDQEESLSLLWNNGVGKHFVRCLTSIYIKKNNYTFHDMKEYLRGISDNIYNEFFKYYNPKSTKERVNKYLLWLKSYSAFLIFNRIYKNNY